MTPPAAMIPGIELSVLLASGGSVAVVAGALALGLRHGIDWDHIAAIADITSTAAAPSDEGTPDTDEDWLTREPGLLLTDESHHASHHARASGSRARPRATALAGGPSSASRTSAQQAPGATAAARLWRRQQRPLLLGTLYALGHATVVIALGLLALLASSLLPDWIDPIMTRVVGATLLLLAGYLYYSVYRYFRGGEFRMRSRWMLVFSLARDGWGWLLARLRRHPYHQVAHAPQQYGPRTAYGIGAIHGIGAETGTQVLLIAAATGASSRAAGIAALLAFVVGLLISNSFVTIASTAGFVSASRRQWLYVGAGLLAATFSLVIGVAFVFGQDSALLDLDQYFRWIGGPA